MSELTRKIFRAEAAAVNEHLAGPSALDEARAALHQYALMAGPGFVDRLERFEAAVRANERAGTTRAALLDEAANNLNHAISNCPTTDARHCLSCQTKAAASRELHRMADEAVQP